MLPEGSKAPAAFPRLRVNPDAPSGPPGFVRYGACRPTTGDCRLPRAPPQAVVSELSSQRPRSGSRNGIGRMACLYFSDAVLRTSDRCRVDSSQRRLGDGGACGRFVAPRSPSGSGQPRSGRRPSGACTRVRSGKISVDRPDWDHAQRRALRGIFGGDARTAACAMVCCRRLVTCDRGNRRRGIGGRRDHLCVVDRRGTRAQADCVARSGTGSRCVWPPP